MSTVDHAYPALTKQPCACTVKSRYHTGSLFSQLFPLSCFHSMGIYTSTDKMSGTKHRHTSVQRYQRWFDVMVYSILSNRLFPLWPDRADVQCVFHYDTQARAIRCLHLQQQLLCWSPDTHTHCPLSLLLYLSFPSGYFMVLSSPMASIPPRLMFCSHKYKSRSPRNAMTLIWSKPFLAAILFASQRVGDRQGPLDFQHVDRLGTSIPVCSTFSPHLSKHCHSASFRRVFEQTGSVCPRPVLIASERSSDF